MSSFEKSLSWLEELAKAEISMEQTGKIDAFGHWDEEKILKDHSIDFLNQLRTIFQNYASHFNELRRDSRSTIKIYGISGTEADFLVFRNSVKLLVTYSKPGQLEISFHTLSGGLYTPTHRKVGSTRNKIPPPPSEIEGAVGDLIHIELGPFNEAYWTFQGIPIAAPALVRFYLTEFVKNSAC